ncbi:hypothetical protein AQJ46_48270 [Streptomyces canus]|uniref:Uncharacterized protein n=1 Tax=Streptomyces canus TaxID=58343 RepID=A0A101RKH2_9ACTN|nr:hypothetical protein AQJ46_48270 [Streptomyces canus]
MTVLPVAWPCVTQPLPASHMPRAASAGGSRAWMRPACSPRAHQDQYVPVLGECADGDGFLLGGEVHGWEGRG